MTTHLVTSHGADFFGEDRFPLRTLQQIADYALGTHPRSIADPLAKLLTSAGAQPQHIAPDRAAELAEQLLATARNRYTPPKLAAQIRLLADGAARAAEAREAWTWTPDAS
jgi:hypothetical protein